jgi:hypothetical protein
MMLRELSHHVALGGNALRVPGASTGMLAAESASVSFTVATELVRAAAERLRRIESAVCVNVTLPPVNIEAETIFVGSGGSQT